MVQLMMAIETSYLNKLPVVKLLIKINLFLAQVAYGTCCIDMPTRPAFLYVVVSL